MTVLEGRPGGLTSRASADYPIGVRTTGEGGMVADSLSGRYAERNYRGNVFSFVRAAVTVPVNAATLVSVCGIYNPPGSGKLVEIIDTDVSLALATTVVQTFVWVSSTVSASALATFTTPGTARSRRLQDGAGSARVYTAVTHSGTPDVEAHIGGFGKVTSDFGLNTRKWEGALIIPQGVLASICTLTAASTSSGVNLCFSWAEVPA